MEMENDILFEFPEEIESVQTKSPIIGYERLDHMQLIGDLAQLLVDGGTLVYPTDTQYGLGVVPLKKEFLDKIFQYKKRDPSKPLSFMVGQRDMIYRWAAVEEKAEKILDKYWPGPLTIVLKANENCPKYWQSENGEVAFRHVKLKNLNALIEAVGGVLTSTSANETGAPPPCTFQDAYRVFDSKVDAYIDGGVLSGKPSTVVRVVDGKVEVLREGKISKQKILDLL